MARVAGVDLQPNKRVDVALTRIYGIGPWNVRIILEKAQIAPELRVKTLNQDQLSAINNVIQRDLKVEGELRREAESNIKHDIEIGSYAGQRHRKNLPVNGQRTRTNGRTRRGMRRTVGSAKPGDLGKPAAAAPAAKA